MNDDAMTARQGTLVVLLLLVIAGVLVAPYFQKQPPVSWEYQVGSIPDLQLSQQMNQLGQERWGAGLRTTGRSHNGGRRAGPGREADVRVDLQKAARRSALTTTNPGGTARLNL
jgi:hypothetical protein